ncbi:hypothetical protein L9F63_003015, partial [Diploptera punctata]
RGSYTIKHFISLHVSCVSLSLMTRTSSMASHLLLSIWRYGYYVLSVWRYSLFYFLYPTHNPQPGRSEPCLDPLYSIEPSLAG